MRGRPEARWKGATPRSLASGARSEKIHLPVRHISQAARERGKKRDGPRGKEKWAQELEGIFPFNKNSIPSGVFEKNVLGI